MPAPEVSQLDAQLDAQELCGTWRALEADEAGRQSFASRELNESDWEPIEVPGHWRSTSAFSNSDGPLLYRRSFETNHMQADNDTLRAWLVLDGLFYQGDVWLDEAYIGDTEGYFVRHSFEISDAIKASSEHVLAIEATCSPQTNRAAKRNITGTFQHSEYLDPNWNPGGIWRPVRIEYTGPVRSRGLRALCTQADSKKATVTLRAELDSDVSRSVTLRTTVAGVENVVERPLATGSNFVSWTLDIADPELWWPHALGDQPCHDLVVEVIVDGTISHRLTRRIGLRSLTWKNWTLQVNGQRLFLKGTNLAPTRMALAEVSAEEIANDVHLAKEAGLDLIRVHGHIARPELYDAGDQAGMLIWQDLPLHRGYARGTRHQAARQATAAVDQLGHHPSIFLWCAHNEPFALDDEPGTNPFASQETTKQRARYLAAQQLPTWNRTVLDRTLKRSLEKADESRPVIAHSGVLPHPGSGGTDTHSSFGWAYGDERDFPAFCRAVPRLVRFVSELGSAQSVPSSDSFCEPSAWPDLDWDLLKKTHGMQRSIFERHVPPADFTTFAEWQEATQLYQSQVIKHQIETLRRLKYRPTGGFCQFLFADSHPAISSSVLDHNRIPKAAHHTLSEACKPVIVVADRPDAVLIPGKLLELDVHVVSDLQFPLENSKVTARLTWPDSHQDWEWEGRIPADECVLVGRISTVVPQILGEMSLELTLDAAKFLSSNFYHSVIKPQP